MMARLNCSSTLDVSKLSITLADDSAALALETVLLAISLLLYTGDDHTLLLLALALVLELVLV